MPSAPARTDSRSGRRPGTAAPALSAIGDMRRGDAERHVEQHADHVRGGTRAAGAELQLVLGRLRIDGEFGQRLRGTILAHQQDEQALVNEAHRREIHDGVIERLIDAVAAEIADNHLVAVRRRPRHTQRPGHAPAPPTFSITTCWPRISPMRCAMVRPLPSTEPPAAQGPTSVIGRVGQSCAPALAGSAQRPTMAATTHLPSMTCVPFSARLTPAPARVNPPCRGAQRHV